jgi:RNA polymerase sigma-70 factor (ECF subfamily)
LIAACRSGPVRSAFLLSRPEGLGYQEIAERLGMSLSSVEQSLILAASSRQV